MTQREQERAATLFRESQNQIHRRADRLFGNLMVAQWLTGIAAALWLSPKTWIGSSSQTHWHVGAAIFLGGWITALPVFLAWRQPGSTLTRHTIAVAQMLMSALLIHLSGGRIETHFHVFGSLAFFAFYRDWRVLLTATVVVAVDHMVRGIFWPQSVFGILAASPWRWVEHAGWVVFEDIFLFISIRQSLQDMFDVASRRARLETVNAHIEHQVTERTGELTREIAERKLVEQKLRDSLRSLADVNAVLNHACIIATTDQRGTITDANDNFCRISGYSREELVGKNHRLLKSGHHPDSFFTNLWRTISNRGVWRGEIKNLAKDGQAYWVDTTIGPMIDEQGKPKGYFAIRTDITERKRADEERERMELQLRQAQKLESIGQLAAGIAHEINTPTQYIGDNTRFLKDAFTDLLDAVEGQQQLLSAARQRQVTDEMLDQAESKIQKADLGYLAQEVPNAIRQSLDGVDRVSRIVRAMKEFSHPGTGEKTPVDLNHAIESTLTVCHAEWKYVAEVVTDFDPELPLVSCLPGEINQTILNLIVNGSQAIADVVGDGSRGKGVIKVSTRRDGDWAEVRVQDTGTGIPEKARGRVFDPFFTTKAVGKGTGQGLAIAHSVVVEKHGGTIHFETETGKGTTFIIRLPLISQAAATERKAA